MSNTEAIDLTRLIEVLTKANKAESFEAQLTEIELALIEAELHPKPATYCQLLWGIDLIKQIDIAKRKWQPLENDFEEYFAKN